VPEGVLTVLPGMGSTTGKEIVQNPLIRKVDITVGRYYSLRSFHSNAYFRLGRELGVALEVSLVGTLLRSPLNLAERSTQFLCSLAGH
jgi:hypothetical protein